MWRYRYLSSLFACKSWYLKVDREGGSSLVFQVVEGLRWDGVILSIYVVWIYMLQGMYIYIYHGSITVLVVVVHLVEPASVVQSIHS